MTTTTTNDRPRVLIVGGGFAGFHAARKLERMLPRRQADVTLVSPTDYLLYSPLLPDVTAGTLEPRHIAVPLHTTLPRTRLLLGRATDVDLTGRTATVDLLGDGRETEQTTTEPWDRIVLVPGSVTHQLDIPGVREHGHGVKTITEARFLRDHLLTQLDRADALDPSEDAERRERLTVIAVGAGYSSTEVITQLQHWVRSVASRWTRISPSDVHWLLIDIGHAVMPELGEHLGDVAQDTLRRRGIDVRLGISVKEMTATAVTLTDGTVVPSRTLIWGAGVVANPLVGELGLPLRKGGLVVDEQLRIPDVEHAWAAGDAAAVPDLTKPPQDGATGADYSKYPLCPPTAQHAQRQGTTLGCNVAASLGVGRARPYRHRDLGMVADFGGTDSIAKPLGIPLTGIAAKTVTRGYHLLALPNTANRVRVAVDWALSLALPDQSVHLSDLNPSQASITAAEATDAY